MTFRDWWKSEANPASALLDSTQLQMVDYVFAGYKAGRDVKLTQLRAEGYVISKEPETL
jgi:hypothetical protein